jgi:hypothetical protein
VFLPTTIEITLSIVQHSIDLAMNPCMSPSRFLRDLILMLNAQDTDILDIDLFPIRE